MSDLLSIGASGVRAYQTALTAVGENIANTGTDGYSRRSVGLREVTTSGGVTSSRLSAGAGVTVTGIVRATDTYASAAVRSATADLKRTETGEVWLNRIQDVMTGDEVSNRLTGFFTASRALAADPTSTALRTTMLEAANSAAFAFTATDKAFDAMEADFDGQARAAAQGLSSLALSLSKVNDGLTRTEAGTSASAQLADQRDQILSQMSELSDINVTTDELGRATVRIGDRAGPILASPDTLGAVSYARKTGGGVGFTVVSQGKATDVVPSGGSIGGMLDGAERIAAMRDSFNAVAKDFTDTVNTIQGQGQDANGATGTALFALTAGTASMTVALTDASKIAAAANGQGPRNTDNLSALESARNSGRFEARITQVITENASALKQRQTIADAQTAIRDGANAALTGSTGVTLDNEAVSLMRFQQAYSASSRVIQIARETFQSILEIR
ncbi:flagellar hook-associated protein FlgK [Sphingomonas sp. SORGH_AS_0879]|uniref:flagellar hook-associated protein FlgK n=1 Tax=Sphingomonas sp. SORGH_AS_0879 TaxID=3041790 RepID=UPI0027806A64|nr:flagellar hook-associated protein FlgK [Sphingomonas sp. SORGH_AS_0879]MDQ1229086.1 flagellar hook-associated protein 1 FlgK [Sphingomonas sp. SORGH_AS_0879]